MTHSVDTTQPLSSAIPVIIQWVHIQSGQGDKDRGYAWAQQHGPPLIKAHLAMTIAECQQQRPTMSAPCGTIYRERSANYLVTGWLHWTASIMKETVFCSYWNMYSGYRLAFLTLNVDTIMVFYTALLLIKKLISQQTKYSNGLVLVEFTGLTIFPTILM